jgi:Ca2+-binding EF-hand superfamily protein
MTTDPNWLKSITESYRQEVSESARNLQEEAEDLYNLVETIQTALNIDLTEEQVDSLIKQFSVNEAWTTGTLSSEALEKMYPSKDMKPLEDAVNRLPKSQRKDSAETKAYMDAIAHNKAQDKLRREHPERMKSSAADPNVDITDSEAGWARRRFGNLG